MKIEEIEAMQELVRNMGAGFSTMVEALQKTAELFQTLDEWLGTAKESVKDDTPAS